LSLCCHFWQKWKRVCNANPL